MRFFTICLTVVLVGSLTLGGATASAGSGAGAAKPDSKSEGPKRSGAGAERDQGRALLHRGRSAEALDHLNKALKAFQQAGDRGGVASTQDLLGELYERQGRYDLAQQHYRVAYSLYAAAAKQTKDITPPKVPGGRATEATTAVASAATLTAEEHDYNARLMLAKIGNAYFRGGDIDSARAYYMPLAESVKPPKKLGLMGRVKDITAVIASQTVSDDKSIGIGVPSIITGLTAKNEFDRYRQSVLYASLELGLGRLDFKQGLLDPASEHFKNALKTTEGDLPLVGKLGQSPRLRASARTSLGDVAFEQKQYKEATKFYKDAAEGARADKRLDLMWPAQRGSGRSLWALAGAEKDSKKAQKMREDALEAYGQALATIETIRQGSLRADESRTTFLETTGGVFEEAAGALAEMALLTQTGSASAASASVEGPALDYAARALDYVERGRARSLLDMLNEAGADIAGDDVPAELLEQRRSNLARQSEIAALLTGVNLGESAEEKKPKELEEELDKLQVEFDTIENSIRTKSRRYNSLTGGVPLTLEEIRRQVLDDDTTLLEYSLGEERSYLFAVTLSGFTVSRLPGREEVEQLVVAFRQRLVPSSMRRSITDLVAAATDPTRGLKVMAATAKSDPAVVKAYADTARALYAAAVEPAAPLFKQSRLLVVADGALNYVPFQALVTSAPAEGADFSALEYLLKKNETVFAPSASVVAAIRQQRAAAAGDAAAGGMLVVADPVFDASDARAAGAAGAQQAGEAAAGRAPGFASAVVDVSEGVKGSDMQTSAGERRVTLVRLAGTGAEAEQIKELAERAGRKADVWTGLQANEGELEARDLRPYRVLHFATHGLLNAERPQFTGVVLSLVGNGAGADGFLRTDEVFNLKLGSPLVMLSACETGLGRERRGEGVMGLARAFMYAGAPTVGVTLWSVADRSTAELMTGFYENLLGAQPATPSAAMRAKQLALIGGSKYSAPFYWAPFVLVGDWK